METPETSTTSEHSPPEPAESAGRVTPRAVILSLILAFVNDYWLVQIEVVRYSFATYAAPFYNCIFTLLIVTASNFLVRRARPRLALSRVELLTVYVMLSITSAACSHNMMQILVSLMGYAFFFQSPENRWGELFLDRVPRWLTVSDAESLKNFYYGHSTLYTPVNYVPWIVPVLSWSAFAAVLLFTMLCINSILRKHWVESERLTFPIIMLPLEMTEESGALFRNRTMWMGFAIAGFLTFLAGMHYLYPAVPYIRIVRQDIGQYVVNPPWNAMGAIIVGFYFWAIAIAFMMPLELSFSCWVFYWVVKMEYVATRQFGLYELNVVGGSFDRTYPFLISQSYGAYLGFFVMSMWSSRRYLKRVFRTAFLGTDEEDESREAISYRSAVLGLIGGLLFLGVFAHRMGMTLPVICVFFLLYLMFAIIISRIRAELGFPTHDMHQMSPAYPITTAVGSDGVGVQNLVGFSLFHWFNRTYASHPSPHQLEAFKLSERAGNPARQMFAAVLIAGVFALPLGFWNLLHTYYRNGGATANMEMWALQFGNEAWSRLAGWIKQPTPTSPTSLIFVGVGFAISSMLAWLRLRFFWFPLHPLAYAIAPSWGISQLWMPIFIGSTAKFLTLKFGGLRQYRKALPFFFGLILGEVTVGSLWTIVGVVFGFPTYDFWPGKM
ncbi:MAG: hypothetical protein KBC96_06855 [Armatimonadetes bacterium]|nr:hypothetical protein [Armatimonadota bacterium]